MFAPWLSRYRACMGTTDATATRPVTIDDVMAARDRVSSYIRRTPVALVDHDTGQVALKLEFLQHTGTFKARGMFNRILAARDNGDVRAAGVVAASGGNAGMAVAYVASRLDIRARIYVPEITGDVKVRRLRSYGAEVVVGGATYADALAEAQRHVAETGALEVHAYDQHDVVAGQGTLALELREQAEFDTVLVAVGGGGLIGGVTAGIDGLANVVAVEPVNLPTMHNALSAGEPVDIDVSPTAVAADSLGARRAGSFAYATVAAAGVASILVTDDAIVAARRHLWATYRIVVEHSGATAFAALLSGTYVPGPDERVAVVLCGANTDPSDLA